MPLLRSISVCRQVYKKETILGNEKAGGLLEKAAVVSLYWNRVKMDSENCWTGMIKLSKEAGIRAYESGNIGYV